VSLSEQVAACEAYCAYCAERGYAVAARYQDVRSGTTSKRPDFLRLLQDVGQRRFDVVVCWKVDRLGRGLFPMARLLEAVEPAGATIEAVTERVDQRYLGLFASVGKIELDNIRERTTAMRRAYARKGKVMNGAVRYGYRIGAANEPEIDPDEAEVLLRGVRERFDAEQRLRADVAAQRRAVEDAAAHLRLLSDHVARRLEQLTFAERRALLEALVDRIWLDGRNRITIEGVLDGAVPAFVLSERSESARSADAAPAAPPGRRQAIWPTAFSRAIM
jgi:DNA invertase Pin-like site-specific DNA recombinase